jgi:hypothetical protein
VLLYIYGVLAIKNIWIQLIIKPRLDGFQASKYEGFDGFGRYN